MRIRLPLYAKILAWFFLNLVLLAAVFTFLFTVQFSFNLDWFLTSGARARIEAVRDVIVNVLNDKDPEEWQSVLEHFSEIYHVRFALLDDDGKHLVGDSGELPKAVLDRITANRIPPWRTPPRTDAQATPAPATPAAVSPSPEGSRPPERVFRRGPPLRALMRTQDPTQYWLMTSARIENAQVGEEMRVILIARSSSVSGGGLIFDPKPWLWLTAGAVVFSLLFWLPLVRGITRFIGQTTQATRRIAGGRFDVRVKTRRLDELGELGTAINQMAAQLDHLVGGQKRFLGDIAHELCSPLAHLQMTLAILEQRAQRGEEKYVRSAVAKAGEVATLVNELLSFSKASFGPAAVQLQPINVDAAIGEALRKELGETAEDRVQIDIPEDLAVASDRDLFIRAVANVLRNAVRHAGGGPLTIRAEKRGTDAIISIADSGPGVPEADLGRIFDAFYRVDSSRTRATGGTGLGLSIVKTCIETCCGSVVARNREPHGLEVLIQLPVAEQEAAVAGV